MQEVTGSSPVSPTNFERAGLAGQREWKMRPLSLGSARLGAGWIAVAVLSVIGCGAEVAPTEPEPPLNVPLIGRQLAFTVSNQSGRPARLIVGHMGDLRAPVGIAFPAVIAPRTRQEVVFTVPDTNDWAIWVNPDDPKGGELMGWHDIRRCFGRVALAIEIGPRGDASWSAGDPCVEQ